MKNFEWVINHMKETIDLRLCGVGDILLGKHGSIFLYGGEDGFDVYNHRVVFIEPNPGHSGSRTNDGYVFNINRDPADYDIIKIVHKGGNNYEKIRLLL
jgi:hypothetical protein